jgi:hypothetical protein
MAAQGVLVGRLDLVGQVVEVPDVGEAEPAQQLVAGGVGAGELLVGFLEVGLEGVDGFQAGRDAAGVDVGWDAGAAWEGLDQCWGVGAELDGVAVGFGALAGQVGIADDKAPTQQGVRHRGLNLPKFTGCSREHRTPTAGKRPNLEARPRGREPSRTVRPSGASWLHEAKATRRTLDPLRAVGLLDRRRPLA